MSLLQVKLLFCILALLATAGAIISHNVNAVNAAAAAQRQAQAKPFDGGSTTRAIQHYIPK